MLRTYIAHFPFEGFCKHKLVNSQNITTKMLSPFYEKWGNYVHRFIDFPVHREGASSRTV